MLCQYSNLLSKDLFFTLKTNLFLLFQICVCRLQICLQYYPTSFNVKLLLYITIVCIVQAVLIYCITTLSIRILYSTFKEFNIGTYRFSVILILLLINLYTSLVPVLVHVHSNVRIVLIIVFLHIISGEIQFKSHSCTQYCDCKIY